MGGEGVEGEKGITPQKDRFGQGSFGNVQLKAKADEDVVRGHFTLRVWTHPSHGTQDFREHTIKYPFIQPC